MAISNALERNSAVYVYDENGMQIALIPLGNGDSLQGYTSARVNIKRGAAIYSYDEKGTQVGLVPL